MTARRTSVQRALIAIRCRRDDTTEPATGPFPRRYSVRNADAGEPGRRPMLEPAMLIRRRRRRANSARSNARRDGPALVAFFEDGFIVGGPSWPDWAPAVLTTRGPNARQR